MKRTVLFFSVFSAVMLLYGCNNQGGKAKAEKSQDENAVIVEIPDANFKAYLLEHFDTNKDGALSLSEAKAIKAIDCSGRSIRRLDAIEKFANLESLDCSNNQLDRIILLENKLLERLNCTDNGDRLFVNIGMSSKLLRKEYQKPGANAMPDTAPGVNGVIDINKVTYDQHKHFEVQVSFDY